MLIPTILQITVPICESRSCHLELGKAGAAGHILRVRPRDGVQEVDGEEHAREHDLLTPFKQVKRALR